MHIYFAGDHAGFEMKQELMEFVRSLGHDVEDMGPFSYNPNDDYSDFVIPLAKKIGEKVQKGERGERGEKGQRKSASSPRQSATRGIVVAGSGQGEIIAMNRVRGARAALFCPCNLDLIKASRDHNDSNIFALGARFCTLDEAKQGITVWLKTPFSGDERHMRRLQKIEELTRH